MKKVATLLLLALTSLVNGCGTNNPTPQAAATGVWQGALSGGDAANSGFSFIIQFGVPTNGALNFSNFQFLNTTACFPDATGANLSGSLDITGNSGGQITGGTFSLTVTAGSNVLTLTSTSVSGTENSNDSALTNGSIIGNWAVQGSGNGCGAASGTFTMTQAS